MIFPKGINRDYSSISTVEQCGSFCIESGEKENDQCDCRVVGGGV